jgi:hypothetical protein
MVASWDESMDGRLVAPSVCQLATEMVSNWGPGWATEKASWWGNHLVATKESNFPRYWEIA